MTWVSAPIGPALTPALDLAEADERWRSNKGSLSVSINVLNTGLAIVERHATSRLVGQVAHEGIVLAQLRSSVTLVNRLECRPFGESLVSGVQAGGDDGLLAVFDAAGDDDWVPFDGREGGLEDAFDHGFLAGAFDVFPVCDARRRREMEYQTGEVDFAERAQGVVWLGCIGVDVEVEEIKEVGVRERESEIAELWAKVFVAEKLFGENAMLEAESRILVEDVTGFTVEFFAHRHECSVGTWGWTIEPAFVLWVWKGGGAEDVTVDDVA